jgi:drug/metabolite transporter (DMT)-like permease
MRAKLPKNLLKAHMVLLGVTLVWAAAGPIIKLTLNYIPPATFLFLRFSIVSVVLLPYAIMKVRKEKIDKADHWKLIVLGIFSQTNLLILFLAYNLTSVLDATIISVMGSVLSVYAGHYFYKEKIEKKLTIGLIVATVGTLIVMLEPIMSTAFNDVVAWKRILGNGLIVLYNLNWVSYVVWSKMTMGENSTELKRTLRIFHVKPMKVKYEPSTIVTLSFYTGTITVLPFMVIENFINPFHIGSVGIEGVLGLLYMALLSSIVAYLLYQWALEYVKVSDTAIYGYLSPVFTLPFVYWLLGEVPNSYMLLGGALIAVGVIIAESRNT